MPESLAPYPEPSPKQDKLVHRVELFANTLKKISRIIKFPFSPISKFKKKMLKRKWQQRAQAVPKDELIPPQETDVYVANLTQAIDCNFFYVLKNGRIWYKPIAAPKKSPWMLFGPDGRSSNGRKLKAISSDGANLVAIDELEIVNYVHTNDINFFVTDDGWEIQDINLDWTDRWLAIPIINKILGLIKGTENLKLPEDWVAFAISQKGPETGYYTDMSGDKQPEFLVGVTTLYVLCKDGRIYFADPWLANGLFNEITAPEDGQFVAENMAASASTIFLIRRDANGKPTMYARFADFDSGGCDPLLPATYDEDNTMPLVRHLPGENWQKLPDIPLEKLAKVTGEIAIMQTGRGQHNRQLRVEGTNADGEPGFYYKNIYEDKWHFELTPEQHLQFKSLPGVSVPPPPPINLKGQIVTKKENGLFKDVELKKFLRHGLNERGLNTTVEVTLNSGRRLSLPLYGHRGLVHLCGQYEKPLYWKLVMPKKYELLNDPEVKAALKIIFKNKRDVSVSVNELKNGDIEILNKWRGFKFLFRGMESNKLQGSAQIKLKHKHPIFTFAPSDEANLKVADKVHDSNRGNKFTKQGSELSIFRRKGVVPPPDRPREISRPMNRM